MSANINTVNINTDTRETTPTQSIIPQSSRLNTGHRQNITIVELIQIWQQPPTSLIKQITQITKIQITSKISTQDILKQIGIDSSSWNLNYEYHKV